MLIVSYEKLDMLVKALEVTAFNLEIVVYWVMVLQSNWNVAGSNPTGSLFKVWNSTPL